MAYLGRQPLVGNYQVLDAITATTTDTYALTKASVAVFPQTPSNCIVSLNGVIQAPVSSYTISGSNIVFASALTGSDSIDFITVLGDVLNVGTVSDGTISTAKLADSSVTLAKLTATGTQDATTFLRGDNTFASAGGANTPAFSATMSGSQSFSNTTSTKVDFDTETFDTAGAYDHTTNQRFTVPAGQGGKYYIHGKIFYNDQASTDAQRKIHIYKNGVNIGTGQSRTVGTTGRDATVEVSAILPLLETDYIEIYLNTNGGAGTLNGSYNNDVFEGFKIIE